MSAHDRPNRSVFAAYGWPEDITDEGILKNLLALNLERSSRSKDYRRAQRSHPLTVAA